MTTAPGFGGAFAAIDPWPVLAAAEAAGATRFVTGSPWSSSDSVWSVKGSPRKSKTSLKVSRLAVQSDSYSTSW